MTASIWTGVLVTYFAWILLAAAMVAVWGVYVFLAWIGRELEDLIGRKSRRENSMSRVFVTGSFQKDSFGYTTKPEWQKSFHTVKPFDQEKD